MPARDLPRGQSECFMPPPPPSGFAILAYLVGYPDPASSVTGSVVAALSVLHGPSGNSASRSDRRRGDDSTSEPTDSPENRSPRRAASRETQTGTRLIGTRSLPRLRHQELGGQPIVRIEPERICSSPDVPECGRAHPVLEYPVLEPIGERRAGSRAALALHRHRGRSRCLSVACLVFRLRRSRSTDVLVSRPPHR